METTRINIKNLLSRYTPTTYRHSFLHVALDKFTGIVYLISTENNTISKELQDAASEKGSS